MNNRSTQFKIRWFALGMLGGGVLITGMAGFFFLSAIYCLMGAFLLWLDRKEEEELEKTKKPSNPPL